MRVVKITLNSTSCPGTGPSPAVNWFGMGWMPSTTELFDVLVLMDEPAFTGCVLKGGLWELLRDSKAATPTIIALLISKSFAISARSSSRSSNNFL